MRRLNILLVVIVLIVIALVILCFIRRNKSGFRRGKALAARRARQPGPLVNYPTPSTTNLDSLVGASTTLRQGDVISFFGDSITWLGGWIAIMTKAINDGAGTKNLGIKVVNRGINGAHIKEVITGGPFFGENYQSFQDATAADKSTIVVIMIGINDIWVPGPAASNVVGYWNGLKTLLSITKEKIPPPLVVLSSVSVIGEMPDGNSRNCCDKELDQFRDAARKFAGLAQITFVDMRGAYQAYEKQYNSANPVWSGVLTNPPDGVHPENDGGRGEAMIANQMAGGIIAATKTR